MPQRAQVTCCLNAVCCSAYFIFSHDLNVGPGRYPLKDSKTWFIGKMMVPLGWYPSCLNPPRSPLKGDIPNKYPLYKLYMGLIKGTIQRVPAFPLWLRKKTSSDISEYDSRATMIKIDILRAIGVISRQSWIVGKMLDRISAKNNQHFQWGLPPGVLTKKSLKHDWNILKYCS